MFSRNPNFLPLQSTKKTDAVIAPGGVLTSGLLTLPLQNQTRVSERCGLQEAVTGSEGE
jgi:hypothetical protein